MKQSLKHRTEALKQRLASLVDEHDKSAMVLVERLAHQLAICEQCQAILEEEGLIIETARTIKSHPAANISYNATATAIRLFGQLDIDKDVQSGFLDLD